MNKLPQVDFDLIAKASVEPIDKFLAKQESIDKTQWKQKYQIANIQLPQVVDVPSIKKKFRIHFTVKDGSTGRDFKKTIFFGEDADYVFTRDRNERLKKLYALKQVKNPLHADYWRAHICFSGQDWIQNTLRLMEQFLREKGNKLNRLKPKKDFTSLIKKREATIKQNKKH